jgi:hypothetical protein
MPEKITAHALQGTRREDVLMHKNAVPLSVIAYASDIWLYVQHEDTAEFELRPVFVLQSNQHLEPAELCAKFVGSIRTELGTRHVFCWT